MKMGYKKLTLDDMYDVDKMLSDAEERLRNTVLDDETMLINVIRSYLRMKRDKI